MCAGLSPQPRVIAALCGEYMRYLSVGLVPFFAFEAMREFLQAQHVIAPVLRVTAMGNAVHIASCWLLVNKAGWGLSAIALSWVRGLCRDTAPGHSWLVWLFGVAVWCGCLVWRLWLFDVTLAVA